MKTVANNQKVAQAKAEKLAAYWKAKRDAARRQRDIAIAAKNKAHREMVRDAKLLAVSLKAKSAAEARLAGAVKLVAQWKVKVTVAHKHYQHQVTIRKNAKIAFNKMRASMLLARTKADKMEALMKRSQTHWEHSKRILKTSVKAYHLGVHAFKKSERKWAAAVAGTKKTQLHAQMVLKKKWMKKVHVAMVHATKTMKGFKANMAKWRVRWLAARARMNLMKRRAASAKVYFGKVTIVMRTAHRKLISVRKYLKTKLHLKMKYMKLMHKAKRHYAIQLKATALKKKFALKMFASMKHAIKVFVGHKNRMVKAVAAAKAQKIRT